MQLPSLIECGILYIVLLSFNCVATEPMSFYYATPKPSFPCRVRDAPCLTLSEYATKPSGYFSPNSTLIVLPGNHYLASKLYIENVVNFTITGQPNTIINCSQSAGLRFYYSNLVTVRQLSLIGCINFINSVTTFSLQECSLNGQGYIIAFQGTRFVLRHVSVATIVNSLFSFVDPFGRGGAIDLDGCNVSITNSSFYWNKGAVYAVRSTVRIHKSEFISNITAYYGGAVYASNSTIAIDNCIFTNNSVILSGGAVWAESNSTLTIENSSFFNNSATNLGGAVGALHFDSDTNKLIITNCNFDNNRVNHSGGVLEISSVHTTSIHNCHFTNNVAHDSGGVLYIVKSNLDVINNTFINNTAGSGGVMDVLMSTIMIWNATVLNNTASLSLSGGPSGGGAISIHSVSTLAVYSSVFIGNTGSSGGALNIHYDCTATLEDSIFINNTALAQTGGGAISIGRTLLRVHNCMFLNNWAGRVNFTFGGGGGALNVVSNCTVYVIESRFEGNSAPYGGAIHSLGIKDLVMMSLTNTTFISNIADIGAALYIESTSLVSKGILHVHNNDAISSSVYAFNSSMSILEIAEVSNNNGSIYIFSSNVTFNGHVYIENNTHPYEYVYLQEGGALTSFQSEVYFDGITVLANNTADKYGGGILVTESKMFFNKHLTIAHNRVSSSGGGIYSYQSELNFKGRVRVTGNTAELKGGGICSVSSTTRLLKGTLFISENYASRGGGMYLEMNAKLYIIKSQPECDHNIGYCTNSNREDWLRFYRVYRKFSTVWRSYLCC